VRRLRPELWRQKNWLLHHDNAPFHYSSFTSEFVTKNNMTVVSIHSTFLFPPRLRIKLKGGHFDTNEVIEAEPQACRTPSQNTTSRIHLQIVEELGTVHKRGMGLLRG
jgi:hypothetical protein